MPLYCSTFVKPFVTQIACVYCYNIKEKTKKTKKIMPTFQDQSTERSVFQTEELRFLKKILGTKTFFSLFHHKLLFECVDFARQLLVQCWPTVQKQLCQGK